MRITKDCIKKSVGHALLTYEQLRTLLTEVEAVVNSRPLTYVYDDIEGISYALSPVHLLYSRRISANPNHESYEVISTHESLTKRARHHSVSAMTINDTLETRVSHKFTGERQKD